MKTNTLPTFSTTFQHALRTLNGQRSAVLVGALLIAVLSVASYFVSGIIGYPGIGAEFGITYATMIATGVLSFVVSQFGQLFFYILAIRKEASINQILAETGKRLVSFIGLMILVYLKTFVWLTALGVILISIGIFGGAEMIYIGGACVLAGIALNIVLLPKYILSPVFWIVEKTSIIGATKRSAEAAKGNAMHIFLSIILLFLAVIIAGWIVTIVLRPLTFVSIVGNESIGLIYVLMVLQNFVNELFTAVTIAFFVHLAASVASVKPMKQKQS